MSLQHRLMLATLRGTADGHVQVAKACVRAAFRSPYPSGFGYERGYRDALCAKTVEHLQEMRDIQRTVHEYCKGVGYHV